MNKALSVNNHPDFAMEAKELALMIVEENGDLYDFKKQAELVLDLAKDTDIENETPEYDDIFCK